MDILVIGASGMIGSRLATEALSRGHRVTAAARNPEKIGARPGLTPMKLEVTDIPALSAAAASADVVIAAASPRSTGNPAAEAMGYAEALIAGLDGKRLVLVGGAGSLNLADGSPVADHVPEPYNAEARAMRAAFERIAASGIDFTVLAPAGMVAPGERTGTFRLGGRTLLTDAEGQSRISAEDYAVALLDEVERPAHRGMIFTAAY
ncbi:NAD(P)H-binding protein [Roseomonas eburnea]|uniref:NAD(P)H-binding protein n=1 Tax=Neoroseomonas eburnea TaxID=1346889 RepID=A0A9X9X5U5_9PROT|nr:NAD(P)H-binding protein [Neoroseomonas eburnea]MBR0679081.1 NAD(P)H-binding protein [Neoroseomonas eburnea]